MTRALSRSSRCRLWDFLEPEPLGVVSDPCGCRWDLFGGQMWAPCRAHEGEGHLAVLLDHEGLVTARCLVPGCSFTQTEAQLIWAAQAGQQHWIDTRA